MAYRRETSPKRSFSILDCLGRRGVRLARLSRRRLTTLCRGGFGSLGAQLGWGAAASALLFAFAHMLHVQMSPLRLTFDFQPYRLDVLIYVYLRAYARSVWPAVAFHGLWNGLEHDRFGSRPERPRLGEKWRRAPFVRPCVGRGWVRS